MAIPVHYQRVVQANQALVAAPRDPKTIRHALVLAFEGGGSALLNRS